MTTAADVVDGAGAAVILAADGGGRLRSERPAALHGVGGRPVVAWAVAAAREAGCAPIHVVVSSEAEEDVRAVLEPDEQSGSGLVWWRQPQTEAAKRARRGLRKALRDAETVLVLPGDAPLVRPATLRKLRDHARSDRAGVAVLEPGANYWLGRLPEGPLGSGRADAAALEPLCYALSAPAISDWLDRFVAVGADEAQLADAISAARHARPDARVHVEDASEALRVRSRADLAAAQRIFYRRKVDALLEAGVTVLAPESAWMDFDVAVGPDSVLHPGVTLLGASSVGRGCTVHGGAWIRDSALGDHVEVLPYSVLDGARVASGCTVGPFARLRPETVLDEGAKVGNFVEVKNSTLGPGVKASHLAYLGDASVGAGANIGAGVITCNYDGKTKNRTTIGEDAFVGSDTILIAPVEVGAGGYVGAGSVITRDVPEETLAVGRARQKNIKRRPR